MPREIETVADRERLIDLAGALDASLTGLRRGFHRGHGNAGDYALYGRLGHVYGDGDGFLLCVVADDERKQGRRRWNNVKNRLGFCRLAQDGDDEGRLQLDWFPTAAEAEVIREALGIRRQQHLTPERITDLKGRATRLNRPLPAVHSPNVPAGILALRASQAVDTARFV